MTQTSDSMTVAFNSHPRKWRDFNYVYPVISRRGGGLSIGVNLNPDRKCNFNCVYCQVDRSTRNDTSRVDFDTLARELRSILQAPNAVFEDERMRNVPHELRTLRDIAFSGDGEPTSSPVFPAAVGLVAELRSELSLDDTRIIVLTNGWFLRQPAVLQSLAFLDRHNGECWIKLDAGTQEYFQRINRSGGQLTQLLDNLLVTSRVRPVVIQSLFMRIEEHPTPHDELHAYVSRLRWLLDNGGQIKLVQVYTVARRTAERCVTKLSRQELETIADAVRPLGIPVSCYE